MKEHSVILEYNDYEYIRPFKMCTSCLLSLFNIRGLPKKINVTLSSDLIDDSVLVNRLWIPGSEISIEIPGHTYPKHIYLDFADYLTKHGVLRGNSFYISITAVEESK